MQRVLWPEQLGTSLHTLHEIRDSLPDDLIEGNLCDLVHPTKSTKWWQPKECFCIAGWMYHMLGYEFDEICKIEEKLSPGWVREIAVLYSLPESDVDTLVLENDSADNEQERLERTKRILDGLTGANF